MAKLSNVDKEKQRKQRVERKRLHAKWTNRSLTAEDNRKHTGKVHLPMFDDVFGAALRILSNLTGEPIEQDAPDAIRCSFCQNPVPLTLATYGKKPRTVYTKRIVEDEETGEPTIEDVKLHRQDRVIACPSCVLNITPTVSREVCPNCEGTKKVVRNDKEYGCLRCAKPDKTGRLRPTGKVDGSVRSNMYFVSREEM